MSESTETKVAPVSLRVALGLHAKGPFSAAIYAYRRVCGDAATAVSIRGEFQAMQRLGYRHIGQVALWQPADIPEGHDASTTATLPMGEAMRVMLDRIDTLVPATKAKTPAGEAARAVRAEVARVRTELASLEKAGE